MPAASSPRFVLNPTLARPSKISLYLGTGHVVKMRRLVSERSILTYQESAQCGAQCVGEYVSQQHLVDCHYRYLRHQWEQCRYRVLSNRDREQVHFTGRDKVTYQQVTVRSLQLKGRA